MGNNLDNAFFSKVFMWLFVGLLVTFTSGALLIYNTDLLRLVFSGSGYVIIIVLQLALCIFLSVRIHKMSPLAAKIIYLLYSFLTGLTFSSIFLIFAIDSILFVFLVTAVLFGIFALIGKYSKIDLSKYSTFLFIGLVGVILLEIVNMFLMNNTLDMVACIISIVIFLGYVAWDIQRIKYMNDANMTSDNMAIIGAFELYLDFINLFIDLLRLFGKNRD